MDRLCWGRLVASYQAKLTDRNTIIAKTPNETQNMSPVCLSKKLGLVAVGIGFRRRSEELKSCSSHTMQSWCRVRPNPNQAEELCGRRRLVFSFFVEVQLSAGKTITACTVCEKGVDVANRRQLRMPYCDMMHKLNMRFCLVGIHTLARQCERRP